MRAENATTEIAYAMCAIQMTVPSDLKACEEPVMNPLVPTPTGLAVMTAAATATTTSTCHLTKQLKRCSKPGCHAHVNSWGYLQRVSRDRTYPPTAIQVSSVIMKEARK